MNRLKDWGVLSGVIVALVVVLFCCAVLFIFRPEATVGNTEAIAPTAVLSPQMEVITHAPIEVNKEVDKERYNNIIEASTIAVIELEKMEQADADVLGIAMVVIYTSYEELVENDTPGDIVTSVTPCYTAVSGILASEQVSREQALDAYATLKQCAALPKL